MPDEEINNGNSQPGDPPPDEPVENDAENRMEAGSSPDEGHEDVAEPTMNDSAEHTGDEEETVVAGQDPGDMISRDEEGSADTQTQEGAAPGEINMIRHKEFEKFSKSETKGEHQNIDMLLDVTLPVIIELGRTTMPIQDILQLGPGAVVELNKLAGEPVDLLVNDKLIAKAEVVVVDENFGVRVTAMVSQEDRIKSLA